MAHDGAGGGYSVISMASKSFSPGRISGPKSLEGDPWILQSELKPVPLSDGGWLVFGAFSAISIDSSLSLAHELSWPGAFKGERDGRRPYGLHEEILHGGKVLSLTEAGIFRGTIKPPLNDGARGTWVKKTEIPVRY